MIAACSRSGSFLARRGRSPCPSILTGRRSAPLRGQLARVAVAFFTVLSLSTFSFNFDVLLPLLAKLTHSTQGARTCRADRVGLRLRRTLRRADSSRPWARRACACSSAARSASACSSSCLPRRRARCSRSASCSSCGHLLRALGLERPRDAAPRRTGAPARAARRASTSSRSWAGRRSAACSPAGSPHAAAPSSRSRSPARAPYSSSPPAQPWSCSLGRRRSTKRTSDDTSKGEGMTGTRPLATTHCRFGVAPGTSRRRSGSTPAAGAPPRTTSPRGCTVRSTATAAVFAPLDGDGPTLALVAVDIGWFQYVPDEQQLRATRHGAHRPRRCLAVDPHVAHACGRERQLAADRQARRRADRALHRAPDRAGRRQRSSRRASRLRRRGSRTARPLRAGREPGSVGRRGGAVGPAATTPDEAADDTLLVARVTGETGEVRGDAVQLRLPSDDARVGEPTPLARLHRRGARGAWRRAFDAPALFLQGASGELAPRDDYVGDAAVADSNGRQLGHAAAAAIEALPPAGTQFVYTGIVASGANLGAWEYQPCDAGATACQRAARGRAEPPSSSRARRTSASSRAPPSATPDSPQEREKALRREFLALALGDGPSTRCRSGSGGSARRCSSPFRNEPYSVFQRAAAALRGDAAAACSRRRTGRCRLPAAAGDLRHRAATRSSSRRSRPVASSSRLRGRGVHAARELRR